MTRTQQLALMAASIYPCITDADSTTLTREEVAVQIAVQILDAVSRTANVESEGGNDHG